MDYLPCIEVNPSKSADSVVIWLHGLGADGHDFEPVVAKLGLPEHAAIRFIFPHAPTIPVTINHGMVMPAWYDILHTDIDQEIDRTRLLVSAAKISQLIGREIERNIDSSRIVLAGFSQGGAVAYQTALSYPRPLAGLLAMSTYLTRSHIIKFSDGNKALPIQIYHGTMDPVVPEVLGKQAYQLLKDKGYEVDYYTYPMQHGVCADQIADISKWLHKVLL